jgi:hypothetical protein
MEKEKRFCTYVRASSACRWSNGMTETYRSDNKKKKKIEEKFHIISTNQPMYWRVTISSCT